MTVISQSSEVPAKDPAGNTRGQNCGMKSSPAAKYNYHNYVEKTNISVGGVIEIQTVITKDCGSEIYCACRGGSFSPKMFSFPPKTFAIINWLTLNLGSSKLMTWFTDFSHLILGR